MIRRLLCRLGFHRWQPTGIDYLEVPRSPTDVWQVVHHCRRPGCLHSALETRHDLEGLPADLTVSGWQQRADAQERGAQEGPWAG